MNLFEMLEKPFLIKDYHKLDNPSSKAEPEDIELDLSKEVATGFFDDGISYVGTKKQKNLSLQNKLIETYRRIAQYPEVHNAINEIVDEAIFSPGNKQIIDVRFKGEIPDSLKDKVSEKLKKIVTQMNLNKNIYNMFKSFYIDGQLIVNIIYDNDNIQEGIKQIKTLSPINFYFNYSKDRWEYSKDHSSVYGLTSYNNKDTESKIFTREEIIRVDSGIYQNNIIFSNLHTAIKPANMLNTLEDMLIPMRFSRSVSRRIFNVDVSKLNPSKAEEVMKTIQRKFKYQKFYNLEDGTISNQQHISSLTEDYWFPNRGGEKGTTVDTIDETGNLGETGDLDYFKSKLYISLNVPVNRLIVDGSQNAEFDLDASSINREEVKFFNFISRLRTQFLEIFYNLLKREIIANGIADEDEYNLLEDNLEIYFTTENLFFEKLAREELRNNLELFDSMQELIGKYYSYEYAFKNILKMNDEEIKEMSKQIEKEQSDPIYKKFYEQED